MKKVINLSLVLLWVFIGLLVVAPNVFAAEEVETLHLVVYSKEGEPLYNEQITATLGAKTSIDFTGIDVYNKEFAFFIHNGNKINEINTEFIFSASTYVVAVYKDEDQNVAAFVDTNGKLLDIKYSGEGEFKPSSSVVSTKPGYSWGGWDLESDTVFEVDMVIKPIYELLDAAQISVIVTDGHGSGDYEYNKLVTITSDLDGFTHWEDENGVVVSYSNEYTFSAIKNRNLVAKTGKIEEPLIYLQDVTGIRENYNSYLGSYYLPSEYEFIETGVMVGSKKLPSNSIHPTTNEFLRSIPNEDVNDVIRSYLTYKHNGLVETICDKDLGVTFGNDPYNETATTSVTDVGLALYYDAKENGVNILPSNVEFINVSGQSTPTFGYLDEMDIHYVRFTEPGTYVIKLRVKDKNNQYIDAEKTHTITVSSGNDKENVRNIYPNNISANPDYRDHLGTQNEFLIVGKNFTSFKRHEPFALANANYAAGFVGFADFEGGKALTDFTISFKYTSYNDDWKLLFSMWSGEEGAGNDGFAGDWLRLLTNRNEIGIWGDTKQDIGEYQDEGEATDIPLNSDPVYIKFVREFDGDDVELRLYTSLDGVTYTLQTTASHPNANKANGAIDAKLTGFCIFSIDNDFIIEDLEVLGTAFSLS